MKPGKDWARVLLVMMLASALTAAGCQQVHDVYKQVVGNGKGLDQVAAALGADGDVVAALRLANYAVVQFEAHQASLEQQNKARDNFDKHVAENKKMPKDKRQELADDNKKIAIQVGEKTYKDESTQQDKVVKEYIVTDPVTGEPENDKVYTVEETAVKDNKYTGKVDNMDVVFVDTIE